jgi:hypothetical protein
MDPFLEGPAVVNTENVRRRICCRCAERQADFAGHDVPVQPIGKRKRTDLTMAIVGDRVSSRS